MKTFFFLFFTATRLLAADLPECKSYCIRTFADNSVLRTGCLRQCEYDRGDVRATKFLVGCSNFMFANPSAKAFIEDDLTVLLRVHNAHRPLEFNKNLGIQNRSRTAEIRIPRSDCIRDWEFGIICRIKSGTQMKFLPSHTETHDEYCVLGSGDAGLVYKEKETPSGKQGYYTFTFPLMTQDGSKQSVEFGEFPPVPGSGGHGCYKGND